MRRELIVFLVILAVLLAVGLFGNSLLMNIALGQFKSAFPGYDVSGGSVEFRSAGLIAVTGVDVKKGTTLHYKVRSLEISFMPVTLFTRVIPRVAVKDCSIVITDPEKKLKDLIEYPGLKPGKSFMASSVIISNLMLTLNTADWKLYAVADGDIKMGKVISYDAKINVGEADLALLPRWLNTAEKMKLKGTLNGTIRLRGEQAKITEIKGDFSTVAPGGSLVITDKELLKGLADNTRQPLSLIEDSFKRYDFTIGTLGVSRDADSILFHIILDGAKGKKDLTIPLRGF